MTALDENDDPLDSQLLQRIADLNLESVSAPVASPPRTPLSRSPPPYVTSAHHSSLSSTTRPTVYEFASPTRHGFTTEWSVSYRCVVLFLILVYIFQVHRRQCNSKCNRRPCAYCPTQHSQKEEDRYARSLCGLLRDKVWGFSHLVRDPSCIVSFLHRLARPRAETRPLVLGVSSNIYRGYPTMAAAHAAFAYAEARSWTRVCGSPLVTAIPSLPAPLLISEINNPLHASETLDDRWYIVYRGIRPGVYHTQ